jgi:tetratricopeptide (TPR) repeat protein
MLRTLYGTRAALLGSVVMGTLLMSGTVHAETKYERKTAEVKVGETAHIKKVVAKKPDKKEEPTLTADKFFTIEAAVQDMQDTLIDEYKAAIEDTDEDDPRLLDLMFRLAEAYAQKQRFEHSVAMETAIKVDKTRDKGKKAALAREEAAHEKKAKGYNDLAAKAYAAMLRQPKFNKYPRADEVLFYLAYGLQHSGQMELAAKAYGRLVKDFPNSKFVPNAYVAIADQYFTEDNLSDAERFYDKVLKFPKHEVYPYALYKKGWVNFNQAREKESFTAWVEVVGLVKNKKDKSLFRAARKDCVRAFAEFGDPTIALKAFQKIDKRGAMEMYGQLGAFYLDQGKMDKVIYVFRDLMKLDPKNENVCDWEYTVTRAMLTIGTPEQKVKEVDNLVTLYTYAAKNKIIKNAEKLTECRDNSEATTREMAYTTHSECKKTLNPTLCGFAHGYYKTYTDNFHDTPQAPEVQFYYAELLWLRADWEKNPSLAESRWEEAAAEYTKVIDMKGVTPENKKQAVLATVYAWKNALAVDVDTEPPPAISEKDKCDENIKADAIPEKQQKMVAAFDLYIKNVTDPKDSELVTIKFLKGRIFWRYKAYAAAIPLFQDVIDHNPDSDGAEFAANLLMDSENKLCKFDALVATSKLCAEAKGPWATIVKGKDDLRARCVDVVAMSKRKGCESMEKNGAWYDAGTCYVEVAQSTPPPADLDEVLFNAGVCFEKAKAFQTAINVREKLVQYFPDKRTGQQSLYALGQNYAAIGEFGGTKDDKGKVVKPGAAVYFEMYAQKFSAEKDAPIAASNAVFFRKGVGDDQKALDDTDFFVKKYIKSKPTEAAGAFFSMAGIYEKNRKYDDLVSHLREYVKRFGGKGGVDRNIIAHVKMGEVAWRQSCPERGPNGSCVKITRARADKQAARARRKKHGADKRTQCGPDSKIKAVVVDRKGAYLKEAKQQFETAVKLWKNGKVDGDVPGGDDLEKRSRVLEMRYFIGMAKFYLADIAYEAVLDVSVPVVQWDNKGTAQKPSANDKKANAKFTDYLKKKQKMIAEAKVKYLELQDVHPFWAVAGAARVGQMLQNFSDQLFSTPIPDIVQKLGEDTVDYYCDKMAETAEPLETAAIAAYDYCLATSLKLNWSNDWSQLCEAELGQIDPQKYPTAQEIRSAPEEIPVTLGVQPMIVEIKQ